MKRIMSFVLSFLLLSSFAFADIPPKQVLLNTRFIEVSDRATRELGMQFPSPPTQTSFGSRERIGERRGLIGVIIVCIKIKKECGYSIFDSRGGYIGTVMQSQAKERPGRTAGLLAVAESRSRSHFNSVFGMGSDMRLGGGLFDPQSDKLLKDVFNEYQSKYEPVLVGKQDDGMKKKKAKKKKDKNLDPVEPPSKDSVNWGNINLTYKAPKPSGLSGEPKVPVDIPDDTLQQPASLEPLDEQIAFLEKRIADDKKDLEKMPVTDDPLNKIARETIENTIKENTKKLNGLTPERQPFMPGALNADVAFDPGAVSPGTNAWQPPADDIFSGGQHPFEASNDSGAVNPSSAAGLQLGLNRQDINDLAGALNDGLTCRRPVCTSVECFVILIGKPRVYVIETIFGRVVLKKNKQLEEPTEFEPNDPFFHNKKKKKKKLFGILGSSKVSVGGMLGSSGVGGFGSVSVGTERCKEDVKDQWGIKAVGYTMLSDPESAWKIIDGLEKNVIVAVIDSGLDMEHRDGPEFVWSNEGELPDNGIDDDNNGYVDDVNGWNFIDGTNDLTDKNGHGTFVAGIIAAKRNNGQGIAGINPGAVIMPLKVVNKEGDANSFNIYRAIHYAVAQGAKVINISLGGRGISKLEQLAINYAYSAGVFVSIASGNTGEYLSDIGPAAARRAVAVGAIDKDMLRSTISSKGPNNGIMAPGEMIYSLRSKDSFSKRAFSDKNIEKYYFAQSGTSFSAPMVAATASLMFAKDMSLTNVNVEDILYGTATDIDKEGWDDLTGAGILNATNALRERNTEHLVVKIIDVKRSKDKKGKLENVDVYATVRGEFKEFTIEVGKGKRAKKFKTVAGPFTEQADYDWVARILKEDIRGSSEWVIRINVINENGESRFATMLLEE